MKSADVSAIAGALLDVVYPRTCAGCGGDAGPDSNHICWNCRSTFDLVVAPLCSTCGNPAYGLIENRYECSWCMGRPQSFRMARSAARYRGALKTAIRAFKYVNGVHLAQDFASLLSACVDTHYRDVAFDGLAYVPLHVRKERERTYNQSELLARELAKDLRLPVIGRCLRRSRSTSSQVGLSSRARNKNVQGAFVADDVAWIEMRTILLVDDVMTTGSTVRECSRVLKEAGALDVYVVTVARG